MRKALLLPLLAIMFATGASAQSSYTTATVGTTQTCNTYTAPRMEILCQNVRTFDSAGALVGLMTYYAYPDGEGNFEGHFYVQTLDLSAYVIIDTPWNGTTTATIKRVYTDPGGVPYYVGSFDGEYTSPVMTQNVLSWTHTYSGGRGGIRKITQFVPTSGELTL